MTVILLLLCPASLLHKNYKSLKIQNNSWYRTLKVSWSIWTCFFVEISNLRHFCGSYYAWLLFNDEYFYLAFVVLENRKTMILISVYVKIQSFGLCLQINCLVIHKGPSIFNFGLFFFNWDSITDSCLGLVILHKMSPGTHHINYL